MKNREVTNLNLNGWTIKAVIIKDIAANKVVFYSQNRIAIYDRDNKTTEILEEYIVIPEYDNILNNETARIK